MKMMCLFVQQSPLFIGSDGVGYYSKNLEWAGPWADPWAGPFKGHFKGHFKRHFRDI